MSLSSLPEANELAAMARDARRYRWLREHPSAVLEDYELIFEEPEAIDRKCDEGRL